MTINDRAAHVMGTQLLRILALETDVETLTQQRDEARRERDLAMVELAKAHAKAKA